MSNDKMPDEKFESSEALLIDWLRRVHLLENCHYETSSHFRKLSYWIGIPATVLSAFAGTSVFVSMTSSVSLTFKVAVGAVSVLVAILTALQTFLRSDQLSEKHLVAGCRYGVLRQEIEQFIFLNRQEPKQEYVKIIRAKMEAQTKESLEIPRGIFNRVKATLVTPDFVSLRGGRQAARHKHAA